MKTILLLCSTLLSLPLFAQVGEKGGGGATTQKQASLTPDSEPLDLGGSLPEDYDWKTYFATSDGSTASDWRLAYRAHQVLRPRIDALCTQYRELMKKRGDEKALAIFNEMQEHWEKFAAAEILFVGSAWDGGSGAKVAYASHRFEVYLRRIKELVTLKSASMHLNE
jgi:hypothetical protein